MIPSVSAFSLLSSVRRRWDPKCGICPQQVFSESPEYIHVQAPNHEQRGCTQCVGGSALITQEGLWFIHLLTTTTTNHTGAYLTAAARKNRRDNRKRRRKEGRRKEEELITNELRTYYTLLSHIKAFYISDH